MRVESNHLDGAGQLVTATLAHVQFTNSDATIPVL